MMASVTTSIIIVLVATMVVILTAKSMPDIRRVIDVQADKKIATLRHFWASTGLSPPEPYSEASRFLLDQDMTMNLAFIGALPRRQLMQVRIHWLLNLIQIRSKPHSYKMREPSLEYDFHDLDVLVERLHRNQLKPGLELMGNPSRYFTDFENDTQVHQWKHLVTALAKRYIDKYGLTYVQEWNFESWNEPDHKDFDGLNFTVQGFLNYYDACSEGLLAAHASLRLGGPAESFRGIFVNFCWALLEHCVNGVNYFTGQKGVRLDFISIHKKGNRSSISIVQQELETIEEIQKKYPSLQEVPIYNDEADPLVGWWKPEAWRSDTTYASMVAKVINQHQELFFLRKQPSINYGLLSNDNAFLPVEPYFFDQRTLLASFSKNATSSTTGLTQTDAAAQMIRKPVYMVIGLLLHVLGEEQVQVRQSLDAVGRPPHDKRSVCFDEGAGLRINNSLGALAAVHIPRPTSSSKRDSWSLGVVIYNSDDMNSSAKDNAKLEINCLGVLSNVNNDSDLMYVTYTMDNVRTNPAAAWNSMGRPMLPNNTQLKFLRNQEGPISSTPRPFKTTSPILIRAKLRQPGFLAIHLCSKAQRRPGQVTNVIIYNVSMGDVVLTWQTDKVQTRCIRTFEVQFSRRRYCVDYRTITDRRRPIIFKSFQFTPSRSYGSTPERRRYCSIDNDKPDGDDLAEGLYRVRAIDYWSRSGRWSAPISYGHGRY